MLFGSKTSDHPKRLILHIGATKTGSSAMQRVLYENRNRLARRGILYPDVGVASDAHHILAAAVHPQSHAMHPGELSADREQRIAQFGHLWDTIFSPQTMNRHHTVILSSEYLWGVFEPDLYPRWKPTSVDEIIVYAVVRRPDQWFQSSYVQALKSGTGVEFDRWHERNASHPQEPSHFLKVLEGWGQITSPDRVIVRNYDRLHDEPNIAADLLRVAGLPRPPLAIVWTKSKANPSPSGDAIRLLREVNASDMSMDTKQRMRRIILSQSPTKPVGDEFDFLDGTTRAQLNESYRQMFKQIAARFHVRPGELDQLS
ncbi:MAG: hypothetical protein AAF739_01920 [Pseudomonadota bacterium]